MRQLVLNPGRGVGLDAPVASVEVITGSVIVSRTEGGQPPWKTVEAKVVQEGETDDVEDAAVSLYAPAGACLLVTYQDEVSK